MGKLDFEDKLKNRYISIYIYKIKKLLKMDEEKKKEWMNWGARVSICNLEMYLYLSIFQQTL